MKQYFALFTLLCFAHIANAGDKVIWLTDDTQEPENLQKAMPHSIGTDTLRILLAALEHVEPNIMVATIKRIDHLLSTSNNTCVANRIKTPAREAKNLFSLPLSMHPLPRLYFKKNTLKIPANLLNEKQELISIAQLLSANKPSKLALKAGMSYGPALDKQISEIPKSAITYFDSTHGYELEIKLLVDEFIDASLFYPTNVKHVTNQYTIPDDMASVMLAQNEQYIVSHVACTRSPLGEKIIAQINNALVALYHSKQHLDAHLQHLPNTDHPSFLAQYQTVFHVNKAN